MRIARGSETKRCYNNNSFSNKPLFILYALFIIMSTFWVTHEEWFRWWTVMIWFCWMCTMSWRTMILPARQHCRIACIHKSILIKKEGTNEKGLWLHWIRNMQVLDYFVCACVCEYVCDPGKSSLSFLEGGRVMSILFSRWHASIQFLLKNFNSLPSSNKLSFLWLCVSVSEACEYLHSARYHRRQSE